MTRCVRCREETHSRRRITLENYTDTQAYHLAGPVCRECWETIAGEISKKHEVSSP